MYVFYCDGENSTGFGHVARCVQLASILTETRSTGDIAFCGRYDAAVRDRISGPLPNATILPADTAPVGGIAVIDRMPDSQDPDESDPSFVRRVCATSRSALYICSGSQPPAAQSNMISVGYHPFSRAAERADVRWGLEYSPVPLEFRRHLSLPRDPTRAFVGLGGGGGDLALEHVLKALESIDQIETIDVLVSPVAAYRSAGLTLAKPVEYHSNVPSTGPFLARAGLVIASFGNLMYEALSLGAPTCVVGQKKFQIEYAGEFERLGLARCGGNPAQPSAMAALVDAFERTLADAEQMSASALENIDDRGLTRIAALIPELSAGSGRAAG